MTTAAELKTLNADRWRRAKIAPDRKAEVMLTAKRLVSNKTRYQTVEQRTNVPWFIVAVLHEREASGSFKKQLGQGDPLNEVSKHVPKGRGPFKTWEDGAYDALVLCPPFATRNKDWSIGGALTLTEDYNGLGPETVHHIPSGYVWGATSIEERGKYTGDGHWDGSVWDEQIGTAALLMGMQALDQSIQFGGVSAPAAAPTPVVPAPTPAAPATEPAPETSPIPAPTQAPETAPASSAGLLSTLAKALFAAFFRK